MSEASVSVNTPLMLALVRAWGNQPWSEAHRAALLDHLAELGRDGEATLVAIAFEPVAVPRDLFARLPRRGRQRILKAWQGRLRQVFYASRSAVGCPRFPPASRSGAD